jgi:hypothetical protein
VGFNERQTSPEVGHGVREVSPAQIRASQTKARRRHVERIRERLGPREASLAECQGLVKRANFGEAARQEGTGEGVAGVPTD